MPHIFNVNTVPATGSLAIHAFLTALLTQGWTKPRDSDGTTYSSGGTQVTGGGSGANGLANTNAWFVLRDPGGVRSFAFQRGTTNLLWKVKYSRAAGFSGGSPAAGVMASATDEITLLGGGTDASPTFATFMGTDGTYRFNCCACDSTLGYSFYWFAFTSGDSISVQRCMFLDVMATGTFASGDPDPAVVFIPAAAGVNVFSGYSNQGLDSKSSTGGVARAWFGTVPDWRLCPTIQYIDGNSGIQQAPFNISSVGSFGINSVTGKDDLLPAMYGRTTSVSTSNVGSPYGFKGFGQLIRWSTKFRAQFDTLSVASPGARDYIWISCAALPWNGSAPVI